jgi:hypothetical protein
MAGMNLAKLVGGELAKAIGSKAAGPAGGQESQEAAAFQRVVAQMIAQAAQRAQGPLQEALREMASGGSSKT